MNKAIFFVSDSHFGRENRIKEQRRIKAFLDFLDMVEKNGSTLYILGDIFEFYFEYKSSVFKHYFDIFSKLKNLADNGVRLFFIPGNHDAWHIDFFEKYLGVKLLNSPAKVELDGKLVFLHHGDGVIAGDFGYRVMKSLIQSRIFVKLFRLVHPDIARFIARIISSLSSRTRASKMKMLDEYEPFVQKKLNSGFDIVIMGHTHIPCIKKIGSGLYINTGDWIDNLSYIRYNNHDFSLEHWQYND